MNLIELNKFSPLHNNKNIIFCKTDFLLQEFSNIEKLKNPVVLISGNSDYPITEDIISKAPKNIIKWYAQNAIAESDILEPIPMGIENKEPSVRVGHGIGYYDRVKIKEEILLSINDIEPSKNYYSNFKVETNYHHRNSVRKVCMSSEHIDWEEPVLDLNQFFNRIRQYRAVVCPAGNGVDTHRLWEVLYTKRIPITIKMGEFKIYKLYEKLPVVILESIDDLSNENLLLDKLKEVESKKYDLSLLDTNYWKNEIESHL